MEEERKELPNSTAVLVLGILSIVFCWCYGIPGIVMGTIALVLSNQSVKYFNTNPDPRLWIGYGNMQAGKICAIIGTCLSAIFMFWVIYAIATGMVYSSESFIREYWESI
jgi:hypothetical protein